MYAAAGGAGGIVLGKDYARKILGSDYRHFNCRSFPAVSGISLYRRGLSSVSFRLVRPDEGDREYQRAGSI